MTLIITSLILLITILIIGISRGKEKIEQQLYKEKEKLLELEKRMAKKKGKEIAKRHFSKERFFSDYNRFLEAKEKLNKIKEKSQKEIVYENIVIQILDKYTEILNDKTLSIREREEELIKEMARILNERK